MAKHAKDWNNEHFNPYADPVQKADEFDKQYEQNRQAGAEKEANGQDRPEPEGRGRSAY